MKPYGTLTLVGSSPLSSICEPLTLSEVRKFLELPDRSPSDAAEDAMLEGFIIAAREQAEFLQGRDLVQKQYELSLDCFPPREIQLRTPLDSVDLGQFTDSSGVVHALSVNTDYIVDLKRGLVMPPYGGSWPTDTLWPSSAVLWRFTSGYSSTDIFWSDAGQRLLVGMKFLISEYFNQRIPVSYDLAAGGQYDPNLNRIALMLSAGGVRRCH